jgi:hypothetical protein
MATPVEGIQGIGKAGVFTQSPDIWRYVGMQQNKAAMAAKRMEEEKKTRDALVEENRKFAPQKVWEPFYAEVEDYIQKDIRDWSANELAQGKTPYQFETERARRMGEARKIENKINAFKDAYTDVSKRIDDDDNLDKKYYHSKVNDYFFNGRQAKPSSEINIDDLENVFNDPKGYNMQNVVSNFMKDLPTNITEKYKKIHSDLGEQFDVTQVKSKLGIQTDAQGNVKTDQRTGMPKIAMTDDVAMAALEDPYLRNYVVAELGEKGAADMKRVKALLTPMLTPYNQSEVHQDTKRGFKFDDTDRANQTGYTVPVASLEDRYDTLYKITHEFDPELLAGMGQGFKDRKISFKYDKAAHGEGEKIVPSSIVMELTNPKWTQDSDEPRYVTKELPLRTEEDKQAAMEELSTVLDEKAPAKQKQGENFSNFRKKKRSEIDTKEAKTGGVY